MIDFVNPFPEYVKHSKAIEQVSGLFKKYNLIPYYGDNEGCSHYYLKLLYDATSLSTSHTSCKNDICTYSFSGTLDIIPRREVIEVERIEDERTLLNSTQKLAYLQSLKDVGVNLQKIPRLTKNLFNDLGDVGNAYLLIRLVKVGSVYKVFFFPIRSCNAAYVTKKGQNSNVLMVTDYWDEEWWKIVKPKFYMTSDDCDTQFNWSKKDNVWETVVHLKDLEDGSPFYGRAKIMSELNWLFVEYSMSDLACKVASTEYVSKHILAFEEEDPIRFRNKKGSRQQQFQKRIDAIRDITTVEGANPSTLAGIQYPHGSNAPSLLQLTVSRDTDFTKCQLESASSAIFSKWSWHKELVGFEKMRSNTGRSLIRELFTVRNISTIRPNQRKWENFWGTVFHEIFKIAKPNTPDYTVKFADSLTELIQALGEQENGSRGQDIIESI